MLTKLRIENFRGWKDALAREGVTVSFLCHELVAEEKVDGANLGISFDDCGSVKCQNRGAYLESPFRGQWKKLPAWLSSKADLFLDVLTDHYILFGEWLYAQHSVYYDQLPDWFLGFDIFDKHERKFFSSQRRDSMFQRLGICPAPFIARGHLSLHALTAPYFQSPWYP